MSVYSRFEYGGISSDLYLNGLIKITDKNNIKIGKNVHIGDNAFLRTEGGLTIGDNTHISRNLTVYTANHDYNGSRLPYDDNFTYKSVVIGKNVWIGMNVNILPGVTIGDGAIVGMGCTVWRDISPLEIVGQDGLKVIKERDLNHYNKLEESGMYGGRGGQEI